MKKQNKKKKNQNKSKNELYTRTNWKVDHYQKRCGSKTHANLFYLMERTNGKKKLSEYSKNDCFGATCFVWLFLNRAEIQMTWNTLIFEWSRSFSLLLRAHVKSKMRCERKFIGAGWVYSVESAKELAIENITHTHTRTHRNQKKRTND